MLKKRSCNINIIFNSLWSSVMTSFSLSSKLPLCCMSICCCFCKFAPLQKRTAELQTTSSISFSVKRHGMQGGQIHALIACSVLESYKESNQEQHYYFYTFNSLYISKHIIQDGAAMFGMPRFPPGLVDFGLF